MNLPCYPERTHANQSCRLEDHIARLQHNARRRAGRKQKSLASNTGSPPPMTGESANDYGDHAPGSPGVDGEYIAPAATGRNAPPTQRKCANCGQTGHIKTNKKLVQFLFSTLFRGLCSIRRRTRSCRVRCERTAALEHLGEHFVAVYA